MAEEGLSQFFYCALRMLSPRKSLIKRCIIFALCASVVSLVCFAFYVANVPLNTDDKFGKQPSGSSVIAPALKIEDFDHPLLDKTTLYPNKQFREIEQNGNYNQSQPNKLTFMPPVQASESRNKSTSVIYRVEPRALVLVSIEQIADILEVLDACRFTFKLENIYKPLPRLTRKDRAKYAVIIFDRLDTYLNMPTDNRKVLEDYCRATNTGMLIFAQPKVRLHHAQVAEFPLYLQSQVELVNMQVNAESKILNITKAGSTIANLMGSDWTIFHSNHSTYQPITTAQRKSPDQSDQRFPTAILDRGTYDGVRRVILGNTILSLWLHRVLMLDAIQFLSSRKLAVSLDRYVQIDIDDIFVGKTGIRMKPDDVQALLDAQGRIAEFIHGFRFNLGFSGKYFKSGSEIENQGDEKLIEHAHNFWWFGHMWRHAQAHKLNFTEVKREMTLNKQFAKELGLKVNTSYAVAPHHSGVYPVHEELYENWKRVWGVRVTSTEGYPHLYPAQRRRGFVHRGIQVLPRQTCGLFTHTIFLDKYPDGPEMFYSNIYGGRLFMSFLMYPVLPRQTCGLYTKNLLFSDYPGGVNKLLRSIYGGELFRTFLSTPVVVFMTHLSNYGNDRLALYTFEKEFEFIREWTNLRLLSVPPGKLGDIYFRLFPQDIQPLWQNPCKDKRHKEIWSSSKQCERLPDFLVLGPQKTGTSALWSFLNLHPNVVRNLPSPKTFEEVQFFGSKNYPEGIDWYLEFFPPVTENRSRELYYEKSATYFASEAAPEQAHAMLPDAKLIIILSDPVARAYSWYQHQRVHKLPAALKYTFHDIVTASDRAPNDVISLRQHCINPGMYAYHLEAWLGEYHTNQIIVVDGEQLKTDPVSVMDRVQTFLHLKPHLDYSTKIRYDEKKGFYCQLLDANHNKCLGPSKGRHYPPINQRTQTFLRNAYRKENLALVLLLNKMGQDVPSWLASEVQYYAQDDKGSEKA